MKLQQDQQFTVTITPLTPIHIGCGMDYEPTETLIHGGNLYPLQGLADWQGEGRDELARTLLGASDFERIQKAFSAKADDVQALASRPVTMPFSGVWQTNRGKIKAIERTAFNALTNQAIIPGSALKGVFRTAWLQALSTKAQKQGLRVNSKTIEQDLLGGSFETDPLRQLKISDTVASANIQTAIVARTSRHRKDMTPTSVPDSGQNYAEVILAAQPHAFTATVSLQNLNGLGVSTKVGNMQRLHRLALDDLLEAVNQQTVQTIQTELKSNRNGGEASDDLPLKLWWKAHNVKLSSLMNAGAALIRIGKHGGAEHLTLAEHRDIKQPKYKQTTIAPLSITLAKLDKTNKNTNSSLMPFGFALLIPDTAKTACEPLLKNLLDSMKDEREVFETARNATTAHAKYRLIKQAEWAEYEQKKYTEDAEKAVKKAQEIADKKAAEDKAANQTLQQNSIDDLIAKTKEKAAVLKGKKLAKTDICYLWFNNLITQAVAEAWSEIDKASLAKVVTEHLPLIISGFMQNEKDGRKAMKILLEPLNLPTP